MEILGIFNDENVSTEELKNFRHRQAVRGVIFDSENNIAILHAIHQEYYGLPGGGVEAKEDDQKAIKRECREEIGCDIKIISSIGIALEYRKKDNLINQSYGYIGSVIGEKNDPIFLGDEDEAEKNSVVVWVPIKKAIELMKAIEIQENLYAQYCVSRDLLFLERAQKILS